MSIEEAQHKQEEFNKYLKKKIRIGNKSEKQTKKKPWLILISFLTKETMLLS